MRGKRMRAESTKQVAIDVLRAAGEPLHTKEITKRVIDSGRSSGLKGKTPEATIAAVVEATDRPEDLSGYRETPARRVLLVEGRQACYGYKGVFESVGNEW